MGHHILPSRFTSLLLRLRVARNVSDEVEWFRVRYILMIQVFLVSGRAEVINVFLNDETHV